MDSFDLKNELANNKIEAIKIASNCNDETYISVKEKDFKSTCIMLHKALKSPVMLMFATDQTKENGTYTINCGFISDMRHKWYFVSLEITEPSFPSLADTIFSASLFEREIKEMFGIEPVGNPDSRRLRLHDEVWPKGLFPLRKDFDNTKAGELGEYRFMRVEGHGVFEIPVGPVHAGIIGPGHFRFSVAGEPIINLESRLGFTHRGIEKLMEGKDIDSGIKLSERVAGESAFAHGLAFVTAIEKISNIEVPEKAQYLRAIFLELERLYNHVADIGAIALDVGFSFPAAYSQIIKENLHALNESLCGNRFLKSINCVGGTSIDIDKDKQDNLRETLKSVGKDFVNLKDVLLSSTSFLDRVDETGILDKNIAEDYGVVGLVGRASGIKLDLRKHWSKLHEEAKFNISFKEKGDVLARLNVRIEEFEESVRLINTFLDKMPVGQIINQNCAIKYGFGLGAVEGWRGPILYWIKLNKEGQIDRCKIVDPSFHNWQALSVAVLNNIVPDFPVCNKSFNLSYPGNDL